MRFLSDKLYPKPWFVRIFPYVLGVFVLGVFVIFAINAHIESSAREQGLFTSLEKLPSRPIGIILGASVRKNGKPSDVLADRLDTAVEAFNSAKIRHLLVSGDNGTLSYNEPEAMKKYLIGRGVPEANITTDYAGFDTYDTMWRAKNIFGVNQATVFTQAFHLPRSVYLANALGISAVGMASDRQEYLRS